MLGFDTADDAAIYKVSDDVAAVLTLDFFTPVVDDPYDWGCIAAANALSDVFAMGGKVQVAMNICAFPKSLPLAAVGDILRGGADKVREAGGVICGGHTIEDEEPKYGLSVFGTVHPDRVVKNAGGEPGDILYYTKKLGTGIQNSAYTAGLIGEEEMREVIEHMKTLNRAGAEAMIAADTHAGTDVTGFGMAGHLHEMMEPSGVSAEIYWNQLPLYDRSEEFSEMYCRPAKTEGVIQSAVEYVYQDDMDDDEFDAKMGVLCDPQTSGGIMCAIAPDKCQLFEDEFEKRCGFKPWAIGKVVEGKAGTIRIIR